MANLETRVARIAEAFLAERRSVRPIDVLVGIGWLAQPNVDRWERGRVASLDRCVQVDADKVAAALTALKRWAEDRGLKPSEADYQDLQFTADGDADAERAYRTHWASTGMAEPIVERPRSSLRIVVISPHNAWTCASCSDAGDFLLKDKAGALCLDCADLGHLEFLPSGDAALTRRATKASRLSAVVVRWSTRRNRYERQGSWPSRPRSNRPRRSVCPTPICAPVAGHASRAAGPIRTCASAASSPPRSVSSSQVVRSTAPRRSHFMRRHAAAAVSDEAPPGEPWTATLYAWPSSPPSAMSTPTTTSLLMSGIDRESARAQVDKRVEDVVNAWRDGVAMLDG